MLVIQLATTYAGSSLVGSLLSISAEDSGSAGSDVFSRSLVDRGGGVVSTTPPCTLTSRSSSRSDFEKLWECKIPCVILGLLDNRAGSVGRGRNVVSTVPALSPPPSWLILSETPQGVAAHKIRNPPLAVRLSTYTNLRGKRWTC